MNEQQLRNSAAELAKDIRKIEKKSPHWTIREWNRVVKTTVRNYMKSVRNFHKINGFWEE